MRLQTQSGTPSRQTPFALANPAYGTAVTQAAPVATTKGPLDFSTARIPPLPDTALEAAALRQLFPATQVFLAGDATETAVKNLHAPNLVYLSTHGFFLSDLPRVAVAPGAKGIEMMGEEGRPRPVAVVGSQENPLLRSGLLSAGVTKGQSGPGEDGVLTALETAGLDLWGTKLVVLSACETGLGDVKNGQGVYGLRRALVLAGAQSQIMSLWRVSDAGTRELMIAYFTRLKAGEGRVEALRQVQLAMLRGTALTAGATPGNTTRQHPYYWAAFIPSGDWTPLGEK